MKKRFLSILLALSLCLTLLPTAVLADTGDDTHTHCVCNGQYSDGKADHTCNSVNWKAWTDTTSLPTESGNYYLTKDVTLEGEWNIPDGTVLCLNGHNITMNYGIAVITVKKDINFTLTDCTDSSNQGKLSHSEIPAIPGTRYSGNGVEVSGGTFSMYGGIITGNAVSSNSGAGVTVSHKDQSRGCFKMYGGTISGNTVTGKRNGGGVYVEAAENSFTMYGGTISGNSADNGGGGVYIIENNNSLTSTFKMYGGTISGNTTSGDGGGVCVNGRAKFEMYNGSITGNTASGTGGGVYAGNSFKIYDQSQITGNTVRGSANNVYLPSNRTIQVNSDNNFIGLVGISVQTLPTSVYAPVTVLTCTDSNVTSLTNTCKHLSVDADSSSQYSVNAAGQLVLNPCEEHTWGENGCTSCGYQHKHCVCYGSSGSSVNTGAHTSCDEATVWKPWTSADSLPTESGNYFLTTDVTVNSNYSVADNTTLKLCLNGHTITSTYTDTDGSNGLYQLQGSGSTLSITDCAGTGKIQYSGTGKLTCIKNSGGTVNMYGGTITKFTGYRDPDSKTNTYGGAIYSSGGTVNMYGGTISGNSATFQGGGVYCIGSFHMYGGTITNNSADYGSTHGYGGGVYYSSGSAGDFLMAGGIISKNTARASGGGVRIDWNAEFSMTGGTITENSVTGYGGSGGGVYISNGSTNTSSISNGTITNNTANNLGGGVYFCGGSTSLALSGKVTISGNTANNDSTTSADNNLHLPDDAKISVGTLDSASSIGISTGTTPTTGSPVTISDITGESSKEYFHPDKTELYVIANGNGGLLLASSYATSIQLTGDTSITGAVPDQKSSPASITLPTATVLDQDNEAMGVTATWEIVSATDSDENPVTLPDGNVTVSGNMLVLTSAAPACTVTLKAKYGTVESGAVTCTITRALSEVTSVKITLTRFGEEVDSIEVPEVGMTDDVLTPGVVTSYENFTATVYDQYGDAMDGQTVEWALTDSSDPKTGVSLTTDYTGKDVLAVKNTANVGSVTLKATVKGTSVSTEKVIPVEKKPLVATYVRIFKDGTPIQTDSINIPATDTGNNRVTYTAMVYDQYGAEMKNQPVTWSLSHNDGVSIENGTLTVTKGATALITGNGNQTVITVYAQSGSATTAKYTVQVTLKKQNPVEVTIENVGQKTYGDDDFTMTASVPEGTAAGSWSWTSSNPSVLNITGGSDTATPTVAIVGAGNATLQATYSGETVIGSWSLYIHVDKKELKADDLEFTTGSTFTKTYDGTTACTTATVQIKDTAKVKSSDELPTPNGSCVYDSADVSATKVTFTTKSSNNSNYTLPRLTLEKSASIAPAPLTFTATAEDRAYNGKSDVTIESVAFSGLQNGEGLTEDTDYTVSAVLAEGEDVNASKTPKNVTVTVTLTDSNKAKNYALASDTCTTTVTISRAKYSGTTEITHSYYYGELGQVPLRNYLVPDVDKVTIKDKTDAGEILDYAEVSKNNNLLFRFKADAAPGKTATVTLHVTSKQNYEPYDIIVTLYVLDKQTQTVQLDSYTEEAVYGDDSFTVTASNNVGNTVSYSSSDPSVATVDSETGEVTIVGAGETVITATAAETLNYKEAKAEYTLKVHKAPLTITAVDQGSYTGTALPEMEYTVSGLVNGDTLETAGISFTMYYAQDGETVDSPSSAGTYDIMFSGAAESANYEITYVSGTLTLRRNMLPLIIGGAAIADASKDRPDFADVPVNAYYADAVAWAADEGITGGVDETHFAPNQSCTRAQTVTFLWRAAGSPEPKSTVMPFADVPANAYYYKAVLWAVENSITTGVTERTFCPDSTCTRVQIVTFLFRYAISQGMEAVTMQELVSGYTDAAHVPGYALSAFNWAIAQGIVQGSNGKLLPDVDCSRAQIVTMLYRLLNK